MDRQKGRMFSQNLPQLSSCGPIEARRPSGAGICPSLLPQLSSCGPIEATFWTSPLFLLTPFRNCQVAAPLKLDRARAAWAGCCPFRNCQVAAPLKHPALAGSKPAARRLPQLSSCGPIEAWRGWACPCLPAAFRNCQVAAPLKRSFSCLRRCSSAFLPQLSSCGPIEACASRRRRALPPAFRNCQVAAPLKLIIGRSSQVSPDLPQLSSCGPIEAPSLGAARLGRRGPSATVKLRPH